MNHGLIPLVVFISMLSFGAARGAAQREQLELLDAKSSATQSAISIVGQVKNISSSDISGVTVYCDFQNASGRVVRSEPTNLETDPLKPNSSSEFKCSTKASPDIRGYSFRFDRMFGGALKAKDSRKK
jgi:hypothetical protein